MLPAESVCRHLGSQVSIRNSSSVKFNLFSCEFLLDRFREQVTIAGTLVAHENWNGRF